ncbi:MAG: hypothetical protein AB7U76_25900, partial [Pirellulales bacterium]
QTVRDSRVVLTIATAADVFRSRLYVNNGQTKTLLAATHRTERGARKWATRILDFSSVGT